MDPRKMKRNLKPPPYSQYLSMRSLLLCFSFFLFLLFLSHHFHIEPAGFRPTRILPSLSVLRDSAHEYGRRGKVPELRIEHQVLFPDSVLLILTVGRNVRLRHLKADMECIYHSGVKGERGTRDKFYVHSILSADEDDGFRWIVRCQAPLANYSPTIGLRWKGRHVEKFERQERSGTYSWDLLTYEAARERDDTVALFVKGLNLRPDRESNPNQFSCHFKLGNLDKSEDAVLTSKAITAAQEVVRCPIPHGVLGSLADVARVEVTVGMTSNVHGRGNLHQLIPSVAYIHGTKSSEWKKNRITKYKLCACTMVWNQASMIREWITYHGWIGVQRWFIYDNNSDDGLKDVTEELDEANYNVTVHMWPWIKSQEAGFSHCALRARDECTWVAFFDVDEFFYFPPPRHRGDSAIAYPGRNTLHDLVANLSSSATIAEIRITCYSFGPSGLSSVPVEGVTLGYTCRLQSPERHKSIVRPNALDDTLLNAVHHFRLKKGFRYLDLELKPSSHQTGT